MLRIIDGLAGARAAAESGATAIVVDALRSSASIAALLHAGAAEVLVCADVPTARVAAERMGDALLAGEWRGSVPDGFDLGNSPTEIERSDVRGRTVVFTSSNGARMLVGSRGAGAILVGGATNVSLAAEAARGLGAGGSETVLIPAGDMDEPSAEDTASAVVLAQAIGFRLDQASDDLVRLWQKRTEQEGLAGILRGSEHGSELAQLGYEDDLVACALADRYPVLPMVEGFIELRANTVARVAARA